MKDLCCATVYERHNCVSMGPSQARDGNLRTSMAAKYEHRHSESMGSPSSSGRCVWDDWQSQLIIQVHMYVCEFSFVSA